jgi:hypothetical protein
MDGRGRALIEPCPSCPAVRILLGGGKPIPADLADKSVMSGTVRTDETLSPASRGFDMLQQLNGA